MRKTAVIVVLALAALLAASVDLFGQAQVVTRKYRIADFTTKTMEVVISGEDFQSMVFRDEVRMRWRVSPFEFCTMQEYEKLKGSTDYYFLALTNQKSRDITTITLTKGGAEHDPDPSKERYEVISIPVASAYEPSGRELYFLPALIDIIQDLVVKQMISESAGIQGLSTYNSRFRKAGGKTVLFCEDDINPGAQTALAQYAAVSKIVSEEVLLKALKDGAKDTLVSYVVAPSDPSFGSTSFHFVIDAETHELFYYAKTLGRSRKNLGFSAKELKKIAKACR